MRVKKGARPPSTLDLSHICDMDKLDTVISSLTKIQKIYESRDKPFYFCWHQHF